MIILAMQPLGSLIRIVTNESERLAEEAGRHRYERSAVSGQLHMKHFSVRQKWVARDAIFGTFFGEVTEVADDGKSGIVVITDDRGNVLDTFSGSAADFQTSGEWQLAD